MVLEICYVLEICLLACVKLCGRGETILKGRQLNLSGNRNSHILLVEMQIGAVTEKFGF